MSHRIRWPVGPAPLEGRGIVWAVLVPLLTASASVVLAGCGGDGSVEEDGQPPEEAGAPVVDSDPAPRFRGDTVEVEMDEYLIEIPDPLPAGRFVVRVRNVGFEEHNLEVHRDSVLWELQRPLSPRETRTMEVVLEPGSYRLICTVSGHEGRGMTEGLTVVEGSDSP